MHIEARRKERFLPYAHERGGLTLRILSCRLDGDRTVLPDEDHHLLSLEGSWRRAELRVEVLVPAELVGRVLPEPERAAPPIAVLLALRCDETRLRRGFADSSPGPRGGASSFVLALDREELYGAAELQAFLVRGREARPAQRGYARLKGARLATARAWTLSIDRQRRFEGRYLEIRYRRFGEDEVIPPHDRGNLYLLEHDQPWPILWINADHEAISAVLDSKASVGGQARLREVIFDLVAAPVWTQLFLRAAGDVIGQGEAAYEWEERVLGELLGDLYPALPAAARPQALQEDWQDLPLLLVRLDAALQRRSQLCAHLGKLVEEEIE